MSTAAYGLGIDNGSGLWLDGDVPEIQNPKCPDHSSHSENVADLMFPDWTTRLLTRDEQEAVDIEVEREYLNCEGH